MLTCSRWAGHFETEWSINGDMWGGSAWQRFSLARRLEQPTPRLGR